MSESTMTRRERGLKALRHSMLVLIVIIVLGSLIAGQSGFEAFYHHWVESYIKQSGFAGMAMYLLFGTVAACCGIPRQLVAFIGGVTFGAAMGIVLSTVAVVLGCILTFYFARLTARQYLNQQYGYRIKRINQFLSVAPFYKTLVLRLLPVGNNLLTNLLAGVTSIHARDFFLGSTLGYLPQMIIFALIGKGVLVASTWKLSLSLILGLLSSLLGWYLYKKHHAPGIDEPAITDSECVTSVDAK